MSLGNSHKGKKFCCMILLLDTRMGNRKQGKVQTNERKVCVECAGWDFSTVPFHKEPLTFSGVKYTMVCGFNDKFIIVLCWFSRGTDIDLW